MPSFDPFEDLNLTIVLKNFVKTNSITYDWELKVETFDLNSPLFKNAIKNNDKLTIPLDILTAFEGKSFKIKGLVKEPSSNNPG